MDSIGCRYCGVRCGPASGGDSWRLVLVCIFGAPPVIVASARDGTWLAPVSTAGIAVLMGLCALYAYSATGLMRRLPLLRPALASVAAVCLVRAFVLIPLAIKHPELVNTFEIVAAIVWATAGGGFALGYRAARTWPHYHFQRTPAGAAK
jgi:hypothetical protein